VGGIHQLTEAGYIAYAQGIDAFEHPFVFAHHMAGPLEFYFIEALAFHCQKR
jgi:hypothetical protein